MKKILLGTTAAALVAAAPAAFAAEEIEVGISGNWTGGFLFGDQDNDTDNGNSPGVGQRSSNFVQLSEFGFNGNTTLDNGIQVGVQIEVEGETDSDQIDDSNVWFEIPAAGDVVRIELGGESMPADAVSAGVSSVVNGGGIDGPDFVGADGIETTDVMTGGGAETPTLNIYSPRIGGFQVGVGYQTDSSQGDRVTGFTSNTTTIDTDDGETINDNDRDQTVSVGVNYTGDIGGVGVAVGAGYENWGYKTLVGQGSALDDANLYHIGTSVDVGAFTIGAAYSFAEIDAKNSGGTTGNLQPDGTEITNYAASVVYTMNDLSFSLGYGYRENENQDVPANWVGDSEETTMWEVGAAYDLGAGVSVSAGVTFFDYEDERDVASAINNEDENSGWYGVVSTSVSF